MLALKRRRILYGSQFKAGDSTPTQSKIVRNYRHTGQPIPTHTSTLGEEYVIIFVSRNTDTKIE